MPETSISAHEPLLVCLPALVHHARRKQSRGRAASRQQALRWLWLLPRTITSKQGDTGPSADMTSWIWCEPILERIDYHAQRG